MAKRSSARQPIRGIHATLGVDIVSYSTFNVEDQLKAVQHLTKWVRQAAEFHDVREADYVWSHAGDGGYLTFASNLACIKAIDIAFSVVRKIKSKEWVLTDGRRLRVRMGLHAGFVQDVFESGLEGLRAVSGGGINMAARVLTLSTADQLLISKEYYDEVHQRPARRRFRDRPTALTQRQAWRKGRGHER